MEGLNEQELKAMLGDRDVHIQQLLKYVAKLEALLKEKTGEPHS